MRTFGKVLLGFNGLLLAFIFMWLLVGGGQRGGYFGGGGGASVEVEGIFLLMMAGFNFCFLLAVHVSSAHAEPAPTADRAKEVLTTEVFQGESSWRRFLHAWAKWGLCINGIIILFLSLWLMISTGRWSRFTGNSNEVDLILLFFLTLLNIGYMALVFFRYAWPAKR